MDNTENKQEKSEELLDTLRSGVCANPRCESRRLNVGAIKHVDSKWYHQDCVPKWIPHH